MPRNPLDVTPFRYPGGKRWFIRYAELFVTLPRPEIFYEPFAGGATVGLSLLAKDRIDHLHMVELNPRVAAFWERILSSDSESFIEQVEAFECSAAEHRPNVEAVIADESEANMAMWVLVKNRCSFGGRLEKGGLLKYGDGKGVASRWNRNHLVTTLKRIQEMKDRITFTRGDGIEVLRLAQAEQQRNPRAIAAFIDPPYTAEKKGAGHYMYSQSALDHRELFRVLCEWPGNWVATYDDTQFVRGIMRENNKLVAVGVKMWTTLHDQKVEAVIARDLSWLPRSMCQALEGLPFPYPEMSVMPQAEQVDIGGSEFADMGAGLGTDPRNVSL